MSTRSIRTIARTSGSPRWHWTPAAPLRVILDRLLAWDARVRSRRQLTELDAHLRRDIGLERAEIDREAGKFFWQP